MNLGAGSRATLLSRRSMCKACANGSGRGRALRNTSDSAERGAACPGVDKHESFATDATGIKQSERKPRKPKKRYMALNEGGEEEEEEACANGSGRGRALRNTSDSAERGAACPGVDKHESFATDATGIKQSKRKPRKPKKQYMALNEGGGRRRRRRRRQRMRSH